MFWGSDFWLETRVINKIFRKMKPHTKTKIVFIGKKQKQNFFVKKCKMGDFEKISFFGVGHFEIFQKAKNFFYLNSES